MPKGTKVKVTAHWDNSANNPLNPDPTATVRWGDQSWDEMLVPFVGVLVDRDTDPAKVTPARPGPPPRRERGALRDGGDQSTRILRSFEPPRGYSSGRSP